MMTIVRITTNTINENKLAFIGIIEQLKRTRVLVTLSILMIQAILTLELCDRLSNRYRSGVD